jgi:hypothetical protein
MAMIDFALLRDASDIKETVTRLLGGKPLVMRSTHAPNIQLQLGPGYEIVGLDNCSPQRLSTEVTHFIRSDASQPIFVLVRDNFDGEHLLWWRE